MSVENSTSDLSENTESSSTLEATTEEASEVSELSHNEEVELDTRESYEELKNKEQASVKGVTPTVSEGSAKRDASGRFAKKEEPQGQQSQATQQAAAQPEQDIPPPATWTIEDKQWFNTQPKEAKAAISRRVAQIERDGNQMRREHAQLREQYRDIEEAVRPYEKDWNSAGISRADGIRRLAAANAKFAENPVGTLEEMARTAGLTLRQAAEMLERGEVEKPNTSQNPLRYSPDDIQKLVEQKLSEREQSQRTADLVRSFEGAYTQLKNETDQFGRYLYPETHDEGFTGTLANVVERLAQAFPTLAPRDLILRGYMSLTGKAVSQRGQTVDQTHKEKSDRAALSVRGGSPASRREEEVPDDLEAHIRQEARKLGLSGF